MASTNSDLNDLHRGMKSALSARWGLLMFEGVALIVLGVLAIAAPFFATIAVELYIGWLFLIAGIVGLVAMFYADDMRPSYGPWSRRRCRSALAYCCSISPAPAQQR